jgi:hypothetical protein
MDFLSLARSLAANLTRNALTLREVRVRFQVAGGADDALGIAGLDWQLLRDGTELAHGQTGRNGEISVMMTAWETLVLRVLGTDYNLSIHPGLQAETALPGQQKRLDALGYLTGQLLTPIASSVPDDGLDGPRTQQAIMNFQCDQNLKIDGLAGGQTRGKIRDAIGA